MLVVAVLSAKAAEPGMVRSVNEWIFGPFLPRTAERWSIQPLLQLRVQFASLSNNFFAT